MSTARMGPADGKAPATCAVVVNWNGWQDTILCLETLLEQDVPLRVVVCDNGSGDGSVRQISAWLDLRCPAWRGDAPGESALREPVGSHLSAGVEAMHFLTLARNLGYAGALNAGIRWAQEHWRARRFWLLNNDVAARPDSLRALQSAHAAVPRAGVCGSVLVEWHRPDEIQAVAGIFRRWLGVGAHLRDVPAGEVLVDADYPVGASLYVEQEYLERVGFMDESYFLYCEEMDWVERGRKQGFRPVIALSSRLRHKEGASTGSHGGVRQKSLLSEHYGVVNRLRITRRFWPYYLPVVWLSLWAVTADRLMHREFARAALVLRLMFSPRLWLA
jgi:GT2 family glycosyltransferase